MATPRVDNDSPVELSAPDITPYRVGNTGIPYATTLDSAKPGPHAMITALVHGNELCGSITLDWLLRQGIRPSAGKVSVVFANYKAHELWNPDDPTISRWVDEDFNRLWSPEVLDGERRSWELERARELRPLLDTVDLLLDLHSMQTPMTPLMLAGPAPKGRVLAKAVGIPEFVVSDHGHAQGKRMRDYGGFSDLASPKNALLVEAGQHWAKVAADNAIETAVRFLRVAGVIDDAFAPDIGRGTPPRQRFVEVTQPVTIRSERFAFAKTFIGGEVLSKGTLIGHDGDEPVVAPHDGCILIMPTRRPWKGMTAVRLARDIGSDA